MNIKNFALTALVSLIFWSCKTTVPVSALSRNEVKEIITQPETTFVDVRIPAQFSENTVKGAVNIPLAEITENLEFFRKQSQTVVFCNSGRQANEAIELLRKNGITNVHTGVSVKNVDAVKAETKNK